VAPPVARHLLLPPLLLLLPGLLGCLGPPGRLLQLLWVWLARRHLQHQQNNQGSRCEPKAGCSLDWCSQFRAYHESYTQDTLCNVDHDFSSNQQDVRASPSC
jgi:hypothetical protein